MRIGVDFDNTLISYDRLFYDEALRRGWIGRDIAHTKRAVREALRWNGCGHRWTELQGIVYATLADRAEPFRGVTAFLERCRALGIAVSIVSHKTQFPAAGPPVDLQAVARRWLECHGLLSARSPIALGDVHFLGTRAAKLERIAALGCAYFVDDLVEVLTDPAFPAGPEAILFDPHGETEPDARCRRCRSWDEVGQILLGREAA